MRKQATFAAMVLIATVAGGFALGSCDATYRVTMPYCPVSDSAWKRADSIPAICVLDTVSAKRHKP